jgi:hypothetical protein
VTANTSPTSSTSIETSSQSVHRYRIEITECEFGYYWHVYYNGDKVNGGIALQWHYGLGTARYEIVRHRRKLPLGLTLIEGP